MNDQPELPATPTTAKPKPQVSIGMPVYNGAKFIREALDSLLAQTFTDFELIISDNASTDDTETICREYAVKDNRIRYVRQASNLGAAANFKYVLDEAVGDYFMWSAYDDLRPVKSLERLYNKLREQQSYVFSFGIAREIDEQGEFISPDLSFDFEASSVLDRIKKYWGDERALKDIPIYGLHKRQVICKAPLAPWRWKNSGNPQNTAHPMLTFCLASGRFGYLQDEAVFYRRILRTGSVWSHAPDVAKRSRFKFYTLKLNLIVRSILAVRNGSQSYLFAVASIPAITVSVTYPIFRNIFCRVRKHFLPCVSL